MSDTPGGKNDTLCWRCARACGRCEWSSFARPVPGWDAEPTRIHVSSGGSYGRTVDSFHVTACPKYTPEDAGAGLKVWKRYIDGMGAVV